jgi:hypothetical protein
MAKKSKTSKVRGVESIKVCKGPGCDATLPPVDAVQPYKGFHYTTPSAQPQATRGEKRESIGCVTEPRTRHCFPLRNLANKSGVSNKCYVTEAEAVRQQETAGAEAVGPVKVKVDDRFTGYLNDGSFDTRCKESRSKPCGDRASCPVQLVWLEGKPNLRFCNEQDEPGYLVSVKDPAQATIYAKKACEAWPHKIKGEHIWPEDFWKKKAPEVITDAARDYPQGGPGGAGIPGLGEGDDDEFVPAIEPPEPFDHDLGDWSSDNILKGAAVGLLALVAYTKLIKPRLGANK